MAETRKRKRKFRVIYVPADQPHDYITGNYVDVFAHTVEDAVEDRCDMLGEEGACASDALFYCEDTWWKPTYGADGLWTAGQVAERPSPLLSEHSADEDGR